MLQILLRRFELAMMPARASLAAVPARGHSRSMRQLLLLRHAKSSWDDRDMPDHARPLNLRGRQAAAAMRQAITTLELCPDLVLVSTARRTRETLAALEPWPHDPKVTETDDLYLASVAALMDALREVDDGVRSVMLVGHNPGLHELALTLLGADSGHAARLSGSDARRLMDGYPSGALAEFALAGAWSGLAPGGAKLVRFLCPRDLPPT